MHCETIARVAVSYVVRPLSPSEASAGAHAWSELAGGTISPDLLRRIETLLTQAGTTAFSAFVADRDGELCGIATARLVSHPVSGTCGEIEALMIDDRLPDEAGDALARAAIEWLRAQGASTISHMRDPAAPAAFWERLGFRSDMVRYTLAGDS
jgi:GNAT superfamily N-acetyltransferase